MNEFEIWDIRNTFPYADRGIPFWTFGQQLWKFFYLQLTVLPIVSDMEEYYSDSPETLWSSGPPYHSF